MKKNLVVLTALVIVLICSSVAIVYSNDRKARAAAATNSAVANLRAELNNERAVSTLHDQANTLAVKRAGDQIILLTTQKTTLCTQIRAARLVQPLCQ